MYRNSLINILVKRFKTFLFFENATIGHNLPYFKKKNIRFKKVLSEKEFNELTL